MKSRTWDQWRNCGYHVIRGQLSSGRDKDGNATFTRAQVTEQEDLSDYLGDDELYGD